MVYVTAPTAIMHVINIVHVEAPTDTVAHVTIVHSDSKTHPCSPVCTAHHHKIANVRGHASKQKAKHAIGLLQLLLRH